MSGNKTKTSSAAPTKVQFKKEEFIPNATFTEQPKRSSLKIEKIIEWLLSLVRYDADGRVVEPAQTIMLEADHGIGKTSFIKWVVERLGVGIAYFSGATLLPQDWVLTFPRLVSMLEAGAGTAEIQADAQGAEELAELAAQMRYQLDTTLSSRLIHDGPFFIVIDEVSRIQTAMLSTFMEVFQSHTVAGLEIPNLLGVIGIRNPVGTGYVGTNVGDMAFESRFPVFELTAKDIPWQEALARKFADTDLSGVFEIWKGLDVVARRTFCPRVVDAAIGNILAGLPTMACLPVGNGRQKILTQTGEDISEATMRKVAAALGQPFRETVADPVRTAARICAEHGWNLRVVGPHGIGKTGLLSGLTDELGMEIRMQSGATLNPSDLIMLLPNSASGKVEPKLTQKLEAAPGVKYILGIDEMSRTSKAVMNQLLEVVQEHSIGGEELTGCHGVIALDNPSRHGALQYKVGNSDDAMISRFQVTLEVTADDIDWRSFLEGKYGDEVVKPFAEWWSQDLNPDERDFVPPRVIETMIKLHTGGMDVDDALPKLGAERIPIRTHALKARLNNRKVLGLSAILAEADNILAILNDPSADEAEKTDLSSAVVRSFQKADLKELEPQADLLVEFVKALPPHSRTAILNAAQGEKNEKGQKKLLFWSEVFTKTL